MSRAHFKVWIRQYQESIIDAGRISAEESIKVFHFKILLFIKAVENHVTDFCNLFLNGDKGFYPVVIETDNVSDFA